MGKAICDFSDKIECIITYTERIIQVQRDVGQTTNGDIPVEPSRRKVIAIWGESNRPYPLAILNDWVNLSKRGCVPERDGTVGEGSKELPIVG